MLDRKSLDALSQKEFDNILVKSLNDLTEYDIGYLKARSVYLTDGELERYDGILNPESDIIKPVKIKKKK